jgi:PKD repeat protein
LFFQAQTWNAVGNGLNNDDHCLGTWNNLLVVGGSFNNNPCDKIANWNGTSYGCFGNGIGTVVRAVISFNGDLVAVGDFWNNNQPCSGCNGVARWNGSAWTPMGTGFNNDVLALAIFNGNLIAAGDFTTADGNPCWRIARWTGSSWVPLGIGNELDNDVRALAVYNGALYIGGDFANAANLSAADRIVKWTGTAYQTVGIPGGLDSTVRVLYVYNNELYMGGHFIEVGGNTNCRGIAKYNGSQWLPLGTGVNSYVRGITAYNGNIIAGGDFTQAGATAASRVAKWNGTSWSALSSGMNDYIRALHVYNGELYAGGAFTIAGGNPRNYIARWYEPPPPPVANFSASSQSTCQGNCISFSDQTMNSPTTWNWSFQGGSPATSTSQNPVVCYNNPGNYQVKLVVTNATGSDSITVNNYITVHPLPNADAGPDQTICIGGQTQLNATGGVAYQWIPGTNLSCSTCPNPFANPTVTTSYVVIVTNSFGCQNTDFMILTVDNCTGDLNIENSDVFASWPNPAAPFQTIFLKGIPPGTNRIKIHDTSGRTLADRFVSGENSIPGFSTPGIYFISIENETGFFAVTKIVVQ